MTNLFKQPALVVVDVQRSFDDADYWGVRDNPECEANIGRLITLWRELGWPLVFVQHDSTDPRSSLHPDSPGHEFKDVVTGAPDLLVRKQVNSSFYGTPSLDAWLKDQDHSPRFVNLRHHHETTAARQQPGWRGTSGITRTSSSTRPTRSTAPPWTGRTCLRRPCP